MRSTQRKILAAEIAIILALIILITTPLGKITHAVITNSGITNSGITNTEISIVSTSTPFLKNTSTLKFLSPKSPPAVILFIGDGMGEQHRTAARWASLGIDGKLNMDALPYSGYTMTADAIGFVTDSAASATAIASGQKTYNGRLGLAPNLTPLPTILEAAQAAGMSVGLVTNVQLSHATPAAFASHVMSRLNYEEIAVQILEHKPDVLFAGGEDDFIPESEIGCHPSNGHRDDGRNLIEEALAAGYTYICGLKGFEALNLEGSGPILGLFGDDHIQRPYQISLAEMTSAAITALSQDNDGFFLMVEGGQIDWDSHANDAENMIAEVLEFDAAVAQGLEYAAANPNALIIVTGDHETGGMSLSLEANGGWREDGPFIMPDGTPFYVNWTSTSHTGVDILTTAQGLLAEELAGHYENTHIFDVMLQVLGLDEVITTLQEAEVD